jgi:hypothetical protein
MFEQTELDKGSEAKDPTGLNSPKESIALARIDGGTSWI